MEQILKPEEFLKVISSFITETNDGLAIVDIKKPFIPIVYVNKGFSLITGYSIDDVLGKNFCFLLGQPFQDGCKNKILKSVETKRPFSIECKYLKKDNNLRDALLSFTPVQSNQNDIEYVFIILEDNTDRKLQIEERAKIQAFKVAINSVNDIVFNYMNYLKLFHNNLLQINGELNNYKLQGIMIEFNIEFRKTFETLKKISELSSFKTKKLTEDFEIIDI